MKRAVESRAVAQEPWLTWNAFIDLLAIEGSEDLSPTQRKAQLVFWYESEVQNGGHGQYFENQGIARLRETIVALRELALPGQAEVLERGADALSRAEPGTAWDACLDRAFVAQLDSAYHSCQPDVTSALERHLALHEAEYIEYV